ncbi:glycosyltransferase family 39 protein [Planotetraspora silvatica]|uniref:glycosyltransferase family 39 protein n=1 Tax=Planotetraspora silvatica TaxID=234614 RepID=UPI00194E5797|nr:glycosyltransferase family 39 protein [Planotetraspora silvatica]
MSVDVLRGRTAVVIPAVVALGAGIWGVDRGSMWHDEATSFTVARRSLPALWDTLGQVDAVHGLYYLLLHPLLALVSGPELGEIVLRVPSVLATGVAAAGVAAVAAHTASSWTGLLAGLSYATTPVVSYYAQEGRSYAMVTAAVVLATLFLAKAVSEPRRPRWWALYGAAVAVGCLLNVFAVFALPAHAVTLLVSRAGRVALGRWALACAAGLVPAAPLAWVSSEQRGQVGWLMRPGWESAADLVTRFAGTGASLVITVGLVVLAFLPRRPAEDAASVTPRLPLLALAAPMAILPPAALLAVSQVRPFYQDRYVLYAVIGLAWLAGAGLAAIGRLSRWNAPGIVVACVLLGATTVLALPSQADVRRIASRNDDPAGAARVIREGARPGDAVLFLPMGRRIVADAYPEDFTAVREVALTRTAAQVGALISQEIPAREVAAALDGVPRVWAIQRSRIKDSHLSTPQDLAKLRLLRDDYRQEARTRVHGYVIRLFVSEAAGSSGR